MHRITFAYLHQYLSPKKSLVTYRYYSMQVFGLQPKSNPPVWVFGKDMMLKLENNEVICLAEHESPYAIISDCCSSYTYKGMGIYINMLLYYTVYIYIYQYSLWTKCISLIICIIAYPYR